MQRYVAFLRGMNIGGRRITNDELCDHVAGLGVDNVTAFLASGNVVFDSDRAVAELTALLEGGLAERLSYDVPVFLRTADQVRRSVAHTPFTVEQVAATAGREQVALLRAAPDAEQRDAVLALATDDDRLAVEAAELYWLPSEGVSTSELDHGELARILGPMTIRTRRTLARLATRFLGH